LNVAERRAASAGDGMAEISETSVSISIVRSTAGWNDLNIAGSLRSAPGSADHSK
jgi:hypothetical protein